MFASLSAFVLIGVTSDGLHAFVGGYSNWLQVTQSAPLPYVYTALSVTAGILAIATRSVHERSASSSSASMP